MAHTSSRFRLVALSTLIALVGQITGPFLQYAFADNTTYYVDATAGSDANDGLGSLTPWQTLAFVNTQIFLPGDQILLKCGESWSENFELQSVGASGNPVVIGSYGTCTSTNKPIIDGGVTASGAQYMTINGVHFSGSVATNIALSGAVGDITITNSEFSAATVTAIDLGVAPNISVTGNTFKNLTLTGFVIDMPLAGSGSRTITGNTFSNIAGSAIRFGQSTTIGQNTFTRICQAGGSDCAAVRSALQDISEDTLDLNSTISQNYFTQIGSGILLGGHQDAVYLDTLSRSVTVSDNTFSGAQTSIFIKNGRFHTIQNNTIYNPQTYGIHVVEDGATYTGVVQSNVLSQNTILTWNPDYPMIQMDDQVDALDDLAALSSNTYLNVYKSTLPIVSVLKNGAATQDYSKDTINAIDLGRTTFTYFGYKNYTSSGVLNPRTNEAILVVNTGSTTVNKACPGGIFCIQYVDTTNTTVSWPTSVPAYGSKIVLWNNAPNILNRPLCTLSTSAGTIPNGQSITLTWTTSGALSNILNYPTSTGSIDAPVADSGTGEFFPPVDDNHNYYYLYTTNDIGTRECSVDIVTQNLSPNLLPFSLSGTEDTVSITGMLQATDSSGDTIFYEVFTPPVHGSLTVQADGSLEYVPEANYCGTEQFEWRAADNHGAYADPTYGYLVIDCVNDAPVAVDDSANATGGVLLNIDVLANDTDTIDLDIPQTFSVQSFTQPSHGTVSANGTGVAYTPDSLYFGPDSFTYIMMDQSGGLSNTGTVTLSVAPGSNFPPTVASGSESMNEDGQVSSYFSGSDLNGDVMTFTAVVLPLHGTLSIVGSGFTYTPNPNFNGSDSFTFVANDGQSDSLNATISLTVNSVQDAPVVADDTVVVEMDTPTQIDVLANDADADNPYQAQTLTILSHSAPTSGTASIVGNRILYIPNSLYLGSDSIEYSIQDQDTNTSNTGIINITVSTDNTPPTTSSGSYSTPEDTRVTGTLSGSDAEGTPLSFVLDTNVSHGSLTLTSTGYFEYTPALNYHGPDSFTFHVSDGVFSSSVETVTLTVDSVNDTPTTTNDTATGTEDTSLTLTPLTNDSDVDAGDTLSLASFTQPSHGTVTQSGTELTYTPTLDYCGNDTLSYAVQDLSGSLSNTGTISLSLTCVNDAPVSSDLSGSLIGNLVTQSGNTLTGILAGADVDGPALAYTVTLLPAHGSLTLTSTGYFVYTPNLGFSGSDSFTYSVNDGQYASTDSLVSITVNPNSYNAVPTTSSGSYSTPEDTRVTGTLSGSDAEGTPLSFVLDTNVSHGALTLTSTGYFEYTPALNYHGPDSFTFHVSDGVFSSSVETITLTVDSANDTPTATNDTATGTEDTSLTLTPLTNDSDVDAGDTLSLASFTQPSHGTVTQSGTELTYTPTLDYCGNDTLSYAVQDLSGSLSNTGTISLSLTCVNDAPIANSDTGGGNEDTPITLTPLTNDSDVDVGDTLSLVSWTASNHGTVTQSGTSLIYTPGANYCGSDNFTYTARDVQNSQATASVTLTINCVNDAPVVTPSLAYTLTGNSLTSSGNVFTLSLTGVDIENASLMFTGMSSTGVLSLTSTGYLTYVPSIDYSGTDTITYTATDGQVSSNTGTITLCIIPPSGSPRPTCAGVVPPPYVPPVTPVVGGGGAGGGSSYGVPPSNPSYTAVVANGVTQTLTNGLYLSKRTLPLASASTITGTIQTTQDTIAAPYNALLSVITEVVTPSSSSSDGDVFAPLPPQDALKLRSAGRSLLNLIVKNPNTSSQQKVETIDATVDTFDSLITENSTLEQMMSIDYLIRIFSAKKTSILKNIQIVKNIVI